MPRVEPGRDGLGLGGTRRDRHGRKKSTAANPTSCLDTRGQSSLSFISQDSRWVVTSGFGDGTFRLWPMPDLSKPPLHTLPHDELIAKLKTLTNLRAVRDEESATGWKVEVRAVSGVGDGAHLVTERDFEFRISNFGFAPARPI